jgi:hypothetical protein
MKSLEHKRNFLKRFRIAECNCSGDPKLVSEMKCDFLFDGSQRRDRSPSIIMQIPVRLTLTVAGRTPRSRPPRTTCLTQLVAR